MAEPLLAVRSVSKVYGSGSAAVHALRGVSFRIDAGDIVIITGPSGSGKSSLLNLLGLLDSPTHGDVVVDGTGARALRAWEAAALRNRHIGFVFQQFHLLGAGTAEENVALPLVYRGLDPAQRRARARDALARVGLQGLEERLPRQLSGGQQQRVAIARALVTLPRVVLCDEPTGNLDRRTGRDILDLLCSLPGEERAVVIVTHDEAVAARGTRRLDIVDGRMRETVP